MRPPSETETSQALRVGGAGPPEPAAAGADVVEAGTALGAQGPAAVASDPVAVAASGLSAREARYLVVWGVCLSIAVFSNFISWMCLGLLLRVDFCCLCVPYFFSCSFKC